MAIQQPKNYIISHKSIFANGSNDGNTTLYLDTDICNLSYSPPTGIGTPTEYKWEILWGEGSFNDSAVELESTEATPTLYIAGWRPVHIKLEAKSSVGTGASEAVLALKPPTGLHIELPPNAPPGAFRLYDTSTPPKSVGWAPIINNVHRFTDYTKNIPVKMWVKNTTGGTLTFGELIAFGESVEAGIGSVSYKLPKLLKKVEATFNRDVDFGNGVAGIGLVIGSQASISGISTTTVGIGENALILITGVSPIPLDTEMALINGQPLYPSSEPGKISTTPQYNGYPIGVVLSIGPSGEAYLDFSQTVILKYLADIYRGDWEHKQEITPKLFACNCAFIPIEESPSNKNQPQYIYLPYGEGTGVHSIGRKVLHDLSATIELIYNYGHLLGPLPEWTYTHYVRNSGKTSLGHRFTVNFTAEGQAAICAVINENGATMIELSPIADPLHNDDLKRHDCRIHCYDNTKIAGLLYGYTNDGGAKLRLWTLDSGLAAHSFGTPHNIHTEDVTKLRVNASHDGTNHYHIAVDAHNSSGPARVFWKKSPIASGGSWSERNLVGPDGTHTGCAGIVHDDDNPGEFYIIAHKLAIDNSNSLAAVFKMDNTGVIHFIGKIFSTWVFPTKPISNASYLYYQQGDKIAMTIIDSGGGGVECLVTFTIRGLRAAAAIPDPANIIPAAILSPPPLAAYEREFFTPHIIPAPNGYADLIYMKDEGGTFSHGLYLYKLLR